MKIRVKFLICKYTDIIFISSRFAEDQVSQNSSMVMEECMNSTPAWDLFAIDECWRREESIQFLQVYRPWEATHTLWRVQHPCTYRQHKVDTLSEKKSQWSCGECSWRSDESYGKNSRVDLIQTHYIHVCEY